MTRTLSRAQLSAETYDVVADFVRQNPGTSYVEIARSVGVPYATVRHRVMEMIMAGEATVTIAGNRSIIFPVAKEAG